MPEKTSLGLLEIEQQGGVFIGFLEIIDLSKE
jgi:hypothetical protein